MTISELLDRRAAELRAQNRSYRARCAMVTAAAFVCHLIAAIVFILFLGHLIQTSARNLAIDVGRAHEVRW